MPKLVNSEFTMRERSLLFSIAALVCFNFANGDLYKVTAPTGPQDANTSPRLHAASNTLIFLARGCKGFTMILYTNPADYKLGAYHIYFGDNSTFTRYGLDGTPRFMWSVKSPRLVNCTTYKSYWINVLEKYKHVTTGPGVPSDISIIEFEDPDYMPINKIAFVSEDATADFIFMSESASPLEVFTPKNEEYGKYWWNITTSGATGGVFRLKACEEARIALSQQMESVDQIAYEIIINNAKSEIRSGRDGPVMAVSDPPNVLVCGTTSYIWISWRDGDIEVGSGQLIGSQKFMRWKDPSPKNVKAVTVKSGTADGIEWTFGLSSVSQHVVSTSHTLPRCYISTTLTFWQVEISSCGPVRVGLLKQNSRRPYDLEMIIGADRNGKTTIRDLNIMGNGSITEYNTPGILRCGRFRTIWMTWRSGILRLGKDQLFQNELFAYTMNDTLPITSMALWSDDDRRPAVWRFAKETVTKVYIAQFPSETPPTYQYNTGGYNSIVFQVAACADVAVVLSEYPGVTRIQSYEVVIGGDGNTINGIRRVPYEAFDSIDVRKTLFCNGIKQTFWVRWNIDNQNTGLHVDFGESRYVGERTYAGYRYSGIMKHAVNSVSFGVQRGKNMTSFMNWEFGTPPAPSQYVQAPPKYSHQVSRVSTHRTYFPFRLRSCKTAILGLFADPVSAGAPEYEFVIAYTSNSTRFTIRQGGTEGVELAATELPAFIGEAICNMDTTLWVSWTHGNMKMGLGKVGEQAQMIVNKDGVPRALNTTTVSFSGSLGNPTEWTYDREIAGMSRVYTNNDYTLWLDVLGQSSLTFRVQACSEASIVLSTIRGLPEGTKEVVIGGSSNTESFIRDDANNASSVAAIVATPGILNCEQFRSFWLSWRDGRIRLGQGYVVGAQQIVEYTFPDFKFIHHVSTNTKAGNGVWDIHPKIEEQILYRSPSAFSFDSVRFSPHDTSVSFKVAACSEARIGLFSSDDYTSMKYEIGIGAGQNNVSFIELSEPDNPPMTVVTTPDILSCIQYRNFWVSWVEGEIQVGLGDLNSGRFMKLQDSVVRPISSVAVTSRSRRPAEWIIPRKSGREVHILTDKEEPPVFLTSKSKTSVSFRIMAPGDVTIVLAEIPGVYTYATYEIKLAQGDSGMSEITKRSGTSYTQCTSASTPGLLDPRASLPFWASWEGGIISFGQGPAVGNNRLLHCQMESNFAVSAVAAYSKNGKIAQWDFSDPLGSTYKVRTHQGLSADAVWVFPSSNKLVFSVRSCADVAIRIASDPWKIFSIQFQITIGRNNTGASIFDVTTHQTVTVPRAGLLNCRESRQFWLEWNNASLTLGEGTLDDDVLISFPLKDQKLTVGGLMLSSTPEAFWQFASSAVVGSTVSLPAGADFSNFWVPSGYNDTATFAVQSCGGAKLSLAQYSGNPNTSSYQITIDPQQVTLSRMINGKINAMTTANRSSGAWLSCTSFQQFWVSWRGATLMMGTGPDAYMGSTILSVVDSSPVVVTAIGTATGNSSAVWDFLQYEGNYYHSYTPTTYGYGKLTLQTQRKYFDFQVQACNDAHVALTQSPVNTSSNTYEIVLGGGGNTMCFIRTGTLIETRARAATPNLLKCNEMRSFRVSWAGDLLRVTTGERYRHTVVQWHSDRRYPVDTVLVSTGWNANGMWRIPYRPDEKVILKSEPRSLFSPGVDQSIAINGHSCVKVSIKACRNAVLKLTKVAGSSSPGDVLVNFGTLSNNMVEARYYDKVISQSLKNTLDCNNFKQFWIGWYNTSLVIGQGSQVRKQLLLNNDFKSDVFRIHGLTFTTNFPEHGLWSLDGFCDSDEYWRKSPSRGGLSGGAIAGIVIGVLVIIVVLAILVIMLVPGLRDRLTTRRPKMVEDSVPYGPM